MKLPEHNLVIDRGDTRDLAFRPKANVNATNGLNWTGSTAVLTCFDARGAVILEREVGPTGDRFVFALTLEERAALPAMTTGRYELARKIAGNREMFLRGGLSIVGAAHG